MTDEPNNVIDLALERELRRVAKADLTSSTSCASPEVEEERLRRALAQVHNDSTPLSKTAHAWSRAWETLDHLSPRWVPPEGHDPGNVFCPADRGGGCLCPQSA